MPQENSLRSASIVVARVLAMTIEKYTVWSVVDELIIVSAVPSAGKEPVPGVRRG